MDNEIKLIGEFIGIIGFALSVYLMTVKSDDKLINLNTVANFTFAIHFFLLGGISASLVSLFACTRNILSHNFNVKHIKLFFLICLMCCFIGSIIYYQDITHSLPILGILIISIGMLYVKGAQLSCILILGSCVWLIYNLSINSYAGIVTHIFMILASFVRIYKLKKFP